MVVPSLQTGLELSAPLRSLPFPVFGELIADGWRCAAVRSGARYRLIFVPVGWPEVQERWEALRAIQNTGPSLPMFVSCHWTPKALLDQQGQLGAWVTPLYTARSSQVQWALALAFGDSEGCHPAALSLAKAIREITVTKRCSDKA